MAATQSAKGTASYATTNGSFQVTNSSLTVSIGDTLLIAEVSPDSNATTISTVVWDAASTNQALTLIGTKACPTGTNGVVNLYGRVSPTSGNKILTVTANISGNAITTQLQSYAGTVTTSVAAACTNVLTANGTSTTASTAAQSGANGDLYLGAYISNGAISSVSDTSIYILAPAGEDTAANYFSSSGSSHTLTATQSSAQWAAVSCDIVASGAAAGPVGHSISAIQAVKRASYW